MVDLSKLTDEELNQLAQEKGIGTPANNPLANLSDEQLNQLAQERGVAPREGRTFFEENIARPVMRTAKSISSATVGLADLANLAAEAPIYIGAKVKEAITGEGKPYEPVFAGRSLSEVARKKFDVATEGLTVNRNQGERALEVLQEFGAGFIGPGSVVQGIKAAKDTSKIAAKKTLQYISGLDKQSSIKLKEFEDAGIDPNLANISSGQSTKTFQNLLGNFPLSRGVIEKSTQKQIDDIANQISRITRNEGGTVQEAGKKIQTGAQTLKNSLEARIDKNYDELDKFIPKSDEIRAELQPLFIEAQKYNTPEEFIQATKTTIPDGFIDRSIMRETIFKGVESEKGAERALTNFFNQSKNSIGSQKIPTSNLQQISQDPQIQDVVSVGSGDTSKVLARYSQIVDEGGNISYSRLKIFRSTVGKKLQSPTLGGDERGAIKQIYRALTEDMKNAVAANGGEKGLQAFNKANNAFYRYTNAIESKINPLINAKTPEAVYSMAMSGSKQGGSNIKGIMKALDVDQAEFVRATIAKRMGMAKPGQQDAAGEVFSPEVFLTEWNRISPEARKNIFSKDQIESINKLNRAIYSIKETSRARQSSNNLPYLNWVGVGGLAGASPQSAIALVGGANITSRMMTDPKFVKWLAQAPNVKPNEISKHISILSKIAATNALLREDILDYIKSITVESQNTSESNENDINK